MTSYPVVFLAKEVKYFKRGFWGVVGVYNWDAQALGCLLAGSRRCSETRGVGEFWHQDLALPSWWDACHPAQLLIS